MHYPSISAKARTLFKENIQGKKAVQDRALDMDSISTNSEVKEIIYYLQWKKFCGKPDEGVLQVIMPI